MASSSARADQVQEAGPSQSWAMGGSSGSEILPAPAPVSEQASSSSPGVLSGAEKYHPGFVAEQIQQSQRHWSELSVATSMPDLNKPFHSVRKLAARIFRGEGRSDKEIAVAMDNRKVLMELQSHPSWGHFFTTLIYGLGTPYPGMCGSFHGSSSVLKVGEKFAEGAQTELSHVHITWPDAVFNEHYQERGFEFVMKVFKKAPLLRHLKSQWPLGLLRIIARYDWNSCTYIRYARYACTYWFAALLEDGRFAFVMLREAEDLRRCLERNMILRTNQDCPGPFSKFEAERDGLVS